MQNEFDQRIKRLEQELLDIKTASEYSSVKSASFTASTTVYTGEYLITYADGKEDIIANIYCGTSQSEWGIAYPRTPQGDTQVVEIVSDTYEEGGYVRYYVPLSITSNRKVLSIARIR